MRPLRILCLIAKSPLPPSTGSRVRIKRLIEGLAEMAAVTVVVAGNVDEDERKLLESWNVGRIVPAPFLRRKPSFGEQLRWAAGLGPELPSLFRDHRLAVNVIRTELDMRPDVLWVSGRIAARLLDGFDLPPFVVDHQGPEDLAVIYEATAIARTGRLSALPRLARLALNARSRIREERWLWQRATLITPVSDSDASRVPARWASKVRVVLNGADIPDAIAHDPASRRVVFVGNMKAEPNADAARWIVEDILPRVVARVPEAELRLVGKMPGNLRRLLESPRVTCLGFVEDLHDALEGCAVALQALRSGTGTKLKVLESLAHGIPVVTTPIGNEGIGTEDGRHLLVGRSAEDLAEALIRVLNDVDLARRLSEAGREFVSRARSWSHAAEELRAGIRTIVGE